ncbi:MAG: ABC transporter ATP-binding protein [Clostridia bacterium]|nr:ABC transporter ATP-binding protein [Clostridia bacterium]
MNVLECNNLTKVYHQGENIISAVKTCNFTVEEGEFVAIVGTSGSGKSTLLQLCGGLDTPSGGTVYINGRDIYKLKSEQLAEYRRKHIGFIFQNYNLIPVFTALENIIMPSLLDGRKISWPHINELLEILGIADRIHHLPHELSGGQQQRVAVARALINYPSLMLADEPTGNLDKNSAAELMKLLLETKKVQHQTLVMVTHDDHIAAMADKVYRMDDGVLSQDTKIKRNTEMK